ncbi:MAG: DUF6427 family protein [Flavobacteriales bacterium]|nr:DUF6427 family protein [Flavobacteriales bacterium]
MVLRQYSSNQPLLFLSFPAIISAIVLPTAFAGNLQVQKTYFPIDYLFKLQEISSLSIGILASILIFGGAVLTNLLYNRFEFQNQASYVPALLYSLLASAFCLNSVSLPSLASNIFLLAGLFRCLQVYRQSRALGEYFQAGFWFGMASLTFPPLVVMLLSLWLMVLFTRAFNWREFVLPLLGFGVPFLYWVVWQYWFDSSFDFILFRGYFTLADHSPWESYTWSETYFFIATGTVLLLALPGFLFLGDRPSNKSRNLRVTFLLVVLGLIAAMGIERALIYEYTPSILIIPFSIMGGLWFSNYRYSLIAPFAFYFFLICLSLFTLHSNGVFGDF